MALQNRVDPFGQIFAHPARGLWLGNRGWLHSPSRTILRPWQVRRWIICQLEFRGRHREVMSPRRTWTELFFLDEATAFAAGHRPCGECRNPEFRRFRDAWRAIHPGDPFGVDPMDRRLHDERALGHGRKGEKRTVRAELAGLPDGAFITDLGRAWLVLDGELLAWSPEGYTERRPRPTRATVDVLTPPSILDVVRAGYRPHVHPTA
ncbi:hypothetical protein LVJ94_29495 [Pendulispora rubella]|uniref:Uncharacterized protein n=1 Tax=Pendulispora rubella TaxID=2741070 RepID=A0ABZ2KQT0_9BACT